MKLFRILYLLFAVILFTTSCSRTNKQLLQAEQLIESSPDSAMVILQKYNYNSLTDKDKALYGLLYLQIQDKKLLALEPDSLLEYSLKYYLEKHNDHLRLAACYLYKGKQFKSIQDYANATNCFLYSYDLIQDKNYYSLLGKLFFELGYINAVQGEYKLSRLKLNKSIKYFKRENSANSAKLAFNSAIFIGWSFHEESLYKEAISYYNSFKFNINDSLQKGVLWQEIAINFYKLKQYDSAKYYLTEVLDYPYLQKNKAKRFSMMADLCFDIRKVDSAIYYSNKTLLYKTGITTRRNIYRILSNSYSLKGNAYYAREFMSKYQDCTDSIRKIDSQTKGSYIETMHNTQKKASKTRSWIWYLSVFILIVISVGIYLYIRKHKKSEQVIEQSRVSYSKVKAEIRRDMLQKKRSELVTGVERLKLKNKNTERIEKRVKDAYNELLHIQSVDMFFSEMDKSYNNIVTKLKTNAPDIKEKELIWCCLQLLDVPIHDMLILLDYESVNSLKRMKGRLAPKLGLINAGLLNDYLLNLSTID